MWPADTEDVKKFQTNDDKEKGKTVETGKNNHRPG